MVYETIALFISLGLLAFFVVFSIWFNTYMKKQIYVSTAISVLEKTGPESSAEEFSEPSLEDYFKEQELQSIRASIAALDQLSNTSFAHEQGPLTIHRDEKVTVDEGMRLIETFEQDLQSAEPNDEEQRDLDLDFDYW